VRIGGCGDAADDTEAEAEGAVVVEERRGEGTGTRTGEDSCKQEGRTCEFEGGK
jgi:hypothetical protein